MVVWPVLVLCVDAVDSELVLWLPLVEYEGTDEVTVKVWLVLVVWPVLVGSDAVEVTVLV